MSETTSDLSIRDNRSENPYIYSEQIGLPVIPRKPISRGDPSSHKKTSKQTLNLPHISNHLTNSHSPDSFKKNKKSEQYPNKNAFAKQMKDRLSHVLGEIPNSQYYEVGDEDEDFDFQAKVNKNKQIIKLHRMRKEGVNSHASSTNKIVMEAKPNNKVPKTRNESLYEKRVKQYRDQSTENKYLQKRKLTMKQKAPTRMNNQSKQNVSKPRDEYYGSLLQGKGQIGRSLSKKNQPRALSHKATEKSVQNINKSVNLFDGIQNFLANQRQFKKQQTTSLVGLTLLKHKRDIEDKLAEINQKLGYQDAVQDENYEKCIDPLTASAKDWRRVDIRSLNLNCNDSNFQKQLQRVSTMQQKNSVCLERYLQNQKILIELDFRRKQIPRKIQVSSH